MFFQIKKVFGFARLRPYLFFHAGLQEHHDAGLDGQGDLTVAPLQVLLQRRAKRRLLRPGVWKGRLN